MYPQGVCRIRKPAYTGNGCAIFPVFGAEEWAEKDPLTAADDLFRGSLRQHRTIRQEKCRSLSALADFIRASLIDMQNSPAGRRDCWQGRTSLCCTRSRERRCLFPFLHQHGGEHGLAEAGDEALAFYQERIVYVVPAAKHCLRVGHALGENHVRAGQRSGGFRA